MSSKTNPTSPVTPNSPVTPGTIAERVDRLLDVERPRYRRMWAYCRNPLRVVGGDSGSTSDRPYRQAQEWGLPPRITGFASGSEPLADAVDRSVARKEVVIENDIAWRIDTMVDYLFGKPLVIASGAPDPARRTPSRSAAARRADACPRGRGCGCRWSSHSPCRSSARPPAPGDRFGCPRPIA